MHYVTVFESYVSYTEYIITVQLSECIQLACSPTLTHDLCPLTFVWSRLKEQLKGCGLASILSFSLPPSLPLSLSYDINFEEKSI